MKTFKLSMKVRDSFDSQDIGAVMTAYIKTNLNEYEIVSSGYEIFDDIYNEDKFFTLDSLGEDLGYEETGHILSDVLKYSIDVERVNKVDKKLISYVYIDSRDNIQVTERKVKKNLTIKELEEYLLFAKIKDPIRLDDIKDDPVQDIVLTFESIYGDDFLKFRKELRKNGVVKTILKYQ
jgi:hypothetical protein